MGASKYCMVTTHIGAMMMLRGGTLAVGMQDAESDVNIVLATGSYRADYTMLCHCARLLLHKLPEDR